MTVFNLAFIALVAYAAAGLAAGRAVTYRQRLTRAQAHAVQTGQRLRAAEHQAHDLRRQYAQAIQRLDLALTQLDGHPYREAEIAHLDRLYHAPAHDPRQEH